MKKERRWSSYIDFEGGTFGYRFNMTRKQWIEQCHEWSQDMIEEEGEYLKSLNSLDDEQLMQYIEDTWNIAIRETSWLEEGGKCYWKDPEGQTSGVYTIEEIRFDEDEILTDDTVVLLYNGNTEVEALFSECYGLTDKICPKCENMVFVSDRCDYPYVCLECDEGHYFIELGEWCN